MAYWAIKRESQQITTGLKRTSKGWEAWGVNLSLKNLVIDVHIKIWDVKTGVMLLEQALLEDFFLQANCSTEFPNFFVPATSENNGKEKVAAIYLIHQASVIARHVNFHEPLKEVPFQRSPELRAKICVGGNKTWLELSARLPVKGVLVEAKGISADEIAWDENGIDLVPEETLRLTARGLELGDEEKLSIKWLGGKLHNLR
jgi:beta-mannosidase